MTAVVLITVQPRHPATGAATTLRLAGGGNRKGYFYAGNHWRAGIAGMPRLKAEIGFDDNGFDGRFVPQTGSIAWAPPNGKAGLSELAAYYWRDAAITIETGDEDTGVFATLIAGKVADAQVRDHQLVITAADLAADLGKPLVTALFAGNGGAEGGAEAKNRIKRRTWGHAFNIEGRVLDKANNVYEFGDPAYPWQSFETVRDKGRDASPAPAILAWQGSVAATLSALAASAPVGGSGVVAPSIACVKWWTQPAGPLTADVKGEVGAGYVETVGSLASRILAAAAGPAVTNAATADGWRTGPAGVHVAENESVAEVLDRLLVPISLLWLLDPAGTVTLREITWTGPVESLRSVAAPERLRTLKPVKTRRIGYQRAYRIHNDGELAVAPTDRQILTASEKPALINQVAAFEVRYTQVAAASGGRATALGISTANAAAAKTAFVTTLLGGLSPPWNDASQDTPLVASIFGDFAFPAGWSFNLVSLTQSGIYWVATDSDGSGFQFVHRAHAATGGQTYTAAVVIKKDATGAATRTPGILLQSTGGTFTYGLVTIDSSTGEVKRTEGSLADYRCVAINDAEWLLSVSVTTAGNNTGVDFGVYPALGVNSSQSTAATGSASIRDPVLVQGAFDALGRDAFEFRRRDYSNELDKLDKAISEADVLAGSSAITGTKSIVIKYDSTGAAQTGELTRTEGYKLVRNGATIMSGLSWTYIVTSGTVNGFTTASGAQAISGAGGVTFSITSLGSDSATVQIKCVDANGVPYVETIQITKDQAPAPTSGSVGGGTGASVSSFASFSSTAMASVMPASPAELVVVAAGTSVALTVTLDIDSNASSATSSETYAVVQWWNGSLWADVGTETASNPDVARYFDTDLGGGTWGPGVTGQINISTSKTGLTAGSTNRFRLMMRRASGAAAATYYPTGTFGAQG